MTEHKESYLRDLELQAEIITALEKELIDLYRKKAQLNRMVTDLLARTGETKSD